MQLTLQVKMGRRLTGLFGAASRLVPQMILATEEALRVVEKNVKAHIPNSQGKLVRSGLLKSSIDKRRVGLHGMVFIRSKAYPKRPSRNTRQVGKFQEYGFWHIGARRYIQYPFVMFGAYKSRNMVVAIYKRHFKKALHA